MAEDNFKWLKWISETQAITQSGLISTSRNFDVPRFMRGIQESSYTAGSRGQAAGRRRYRKSS